MIVVKEASISNNGTSLNINIETATGYNIMSGKLWTADNFKSEINFKDLSLFFSEINNKEIFTVTNSQLELSNLNGIFFLEFTTNEPDSDECSTCSDSITVVVTNMDRFYKCMSEEILKSDLCQCNLFSSEVCDSNPINKAITISLLIETINQCLELGQFVEAIDLMKKLQKTCSNCTNCKSITTSNACKTCNSYVY